MKANKCICGGVPLLKKTPLGYAVCCSKLAHIHNTGFCETEEQAFEKWNDLQNPKKENIGKRERVLIAIRPICNVFGIADYDYIITESGKERLKLNDTYIGCDGNSVSAVIDELIGYIFIKHYCKNRSLGVFDKQTQNYIKRYWMKDGEQE